MEKSPDFLDKHTLVERRGLLTIRENKLLRLKRWDLMRSPRGSKVSVERFGNRSQ